MENYLIRVSGVGDGATIEFDNLGVAVRVMMHCPHHWNSYLISKSEGSIILAVPGLKSTDEVQEVVNEYLNPEVVAVQVEF